MKYVASRLDDFNVYIWRIPDNNDSSKLFICFLPFDKMKYLVVEINDESTLKLFNENKLDIFSYILLICKQLTNLTFSLWSCYLNLTISFPNHPSRRCRSSTLIKLKIDLKKFHYFIE